MIDCVGNDLPDNPSILLLISNLTIILSYDSASKARAQYHLVQGCIFEATSWGVFPFASESGQELGNKNMNTAMFSNCKIACYAYSDLIAQ